jgi:hypothetical protein
MTLPLSSYLNRQISVTPGPHFTNALQCGDNNGTSPSVPFRALVTFGLIPVPQSAQILHAELRICQAAVVGSATNFQSLIVDHIDYDQPALSSTWYAGGTLIPGLATAPATNELGVRSFDVTQAVINDLASNRDLTQFRLRFDPAETTSPFPDMMIFEGAQNDHGTGAVPVLVVTYYP